MVYLPLDENIFPWNFVQHSVLLDLFVNFHQVFPIFQESEDIIHRSFDDCLPFGSHFPFNSHIMNQARIITDFDPIWAVNEPFKPRHALLSKLDEFLVTHFILLHHLKSRQ